MRDVERRLRALEGRSAKPCAVVEYLDGAIRRKPVGEAVELAQRQMFGGEQLGIASIGFPGSPDDDQLTASLYELYSNPE